MKSRVLLEKMELNACLSKFYDEMNFSNKRLERCKERIRQKNVKTAKTAAHHRHEPISRLASKCKVNKTNHCEISREINANQCKNIRKTVRSNAVKIALQLTMSDLANLQLYLNKYLSTKNVNKGFIAL